MRTFPLLVVALGLLIPYAALAVNVPYWGPILSCNTPENPAPCLSLCNLVQTAQNFIYLMLTLALVVLLPFFVGWGGLMILISGGSSSRLDQGKKILTGTFVGLGIGLGAFLLLNTIFWGLGVATTRDNPGATYKVGWPTVECRPGLAPAAANNAAAGAIDPNNNLSSPLITAPVSSTPAEANCSCAGSFTGGLVNINTCNQAASAGLNCSWSGNSCDCEGAVPGISAESGCTSGGVQAAYHIPSVPGVNYTANCTWAGH